MPRTARATPGGYCFHVPNRGNRRAEVFHNTADYDAFVHLLAQGAARHSVRLSGFCLMPNPFHLAVWPVGDGDLGTLHHWLLTTHARRYQRLYRVRGHVWQGRFRPFADGGGRPACSPCSATLSAIPCGPGWCRRR